MTLDSKALLEPSDEARERCRKLAADIMAAMRQAKFPKEYADEAHDEFESLVLTPMLIAALQSIGHTDRISDAMVEAGDHARAAKAAPDLFAALERCESVLRDLHKLHPRFVRRDAEKLLPLVLAALAKARGEA